MDHLPSNLVIHYRHLNHPRAVVATIYEPGRGAPLAVGVAKFNPRDGEYNYKRGEKIARHRAIQDLHKPALMHQMMEEWTERSAAPSGPVDDVDWLNLQTTR